MSVHLSSSLAVGTQRMNSRVFVFLFTELLFTELSEKYKNYSLFYTDGSKTISFVGFAVVDDNDFGLRKPP